MTRLPSLVHPQAIDDEAVYSVVANEIVDGGRPYIDAVERKPPLLFWTYAAIFEVAGKYNWKALHAVALLANPNDFVSLHLRASAVVVRHWFRRCGSSNPRLDRYRRDDRRVRDLPNSGNILSCRKVCAPEGRPMSF